MLRGCHEPQRLNRCGPCHAGATKEGQRLLHVYKRRGRGNSVRDDLESAKASLLSAGNVEVRRHQIVRCDRHAAVVVGAAVENVAGVEIGDAHQGIVGGGLDVVSVCCTLRHAVEPELSLIHI